MTVETGANTETAVSEYKTGFFSGRTWRVLRENLVAYAFLTPALLIIFTFGIFPIFFAGYVSLYKWRIKQNEWRGLDNYINAMGDVAYVFIGLIVIALLVAGIGAVYKATKRAKSAQLPFYAPIFALIPGGLISYGIIQILLRGITFFAWEEAIEAGEAARLGNVAIGLAVIVGGTILAVIARRYQAKLAPVAFRSSTPDFTVTAVTFTLTTGIALILGRFAYTTLKASDRYGLAVVRIQYLIGALAILAVGYAIWWWGTKQDSDWKWVLSIIGGTAFIAGGVWLATIWPVISMDADADFYQSLSVTIWYSIGTVPLQLGISMVIAYMLYQPIKGQAMFRIIFFIPFIAPAVATAGIFQAMFNLRDSSMANQFFALLGGDPLRWLREPASAISAIAVGFGLESAADWTIGGPSLALLVIILYNIWVYVGYDTVIFLAGLANVPFTLYEAAKIDGASSWQLFRHITFPLLSPTTYFLSVVSVIGTFKAFNHIYVLREAAAQGTVDAASVHFFVTFQRASRFGYSTSMAVVLFVVILTLYLIQNRIAAKSVHYA